MATDAFSVFETAIGRCGIAWGEAGVTAVHLPAATPDATRARLVRFFPEARATKPTEVPESIANAMTRIAALLRGEKENLRSITLDMRGVSPFYARVYEVARAIDPGATMTYGEIATKLGEPGAGRAVGQALGKNPFAIVVPCHRVLAAGGKTGGFSATGGTATKLRMLEIEGVRIGGTLSLFS